jgi:hypothetical protein
LKNKQKEQKNMPTFIEIDVTNAPHISDGDCSHYKIKIEGQVPPNDIFFCFSSQLGKNCCSHCMLNCNSIFAS